MNVVSFGGVIHLFVFHLLGSSFLEIPHVHVHACGVFYLEKSTYMALHDAERLLYRFFFFLTNQTCLFICLFRGVCTVSYHVIYRYRTLCVYEWASWAVMRERTQYFLLAYRRRHFFWILNFWMFRNFIIYLKTEQQLVAPVIYTYIVILLLFLTIEAASTSASACEPMQVSFTSAR